MPRVARKTIRLVHWKPAEAEPRIAALRAAGYRVLYGELTPDVARAMRSEKPAAIVIDLTRLPSHGREVAVSFRATKATRDIPLVLVEGDPEKVARLRALLPEAVYTTWARIHTDLARAIAHPPVVKTFPKSALDAYSGTPLPKKLGIQPDAVVLLVGAPPGFEKVLGPLPAGVTVKRTARGKSDVTLWFATSRRALERDATRFVKHAATGGLWLVWPKKTSGVQSDLGEKEVRAIGLASGLVDYKICAVDSTWSGLKFSARKAKP